METYTYQPLDDEHPTRVLQLQPSLDGNSPLKCELTPWKSSDPPYEAVSYTWGDPALDKRLICDSNGRVVCITSSLDTLLRALRRPDETRVLWADAVCINQTDLVERARQVRRMPEIYREASGVVLWLGHDHDGGAEVLRFLQKHEADLRLLAARTVTDTDRRWIARQRDQCDGNGDMENAERRVGELISRNASSIRMFFRRPWFRRRWIIQEAALARKAQVQCGDARMELMAFATVTVVVREHLLFQDGPDRIPSSTGDDYAFSMLESIGEAHSNQNHLMGTRLGSRHLILNLLSNFHAAQCLDGRDRIYSLLGLSDDLKPDAQDWGETKNYSFYFRMPISYDCSIRDTYIEFASKVMTTGLGINKNLQLAGAFRSRGGASIESDLPSWVPDWRASRRFLPWKGPHFTARPSDEEKHKCQWAINNNELTLWGFPLGVVRAKLDVETGREIDSIGLLRETIQKWLLFYISDSSQDPRKKKPPTGDVSRPTAWLYFFFKCISMDRREWKTGESQPADEFVDFIFNGMLQQVLVGSVKQKASLGDWRVVTAGSEQAHDLVSSGERRAIESKTGDETQSSVSPAGSATYTRDLVDFMAGRSLCKDDRGEVINCPDDTQVGDIYAVFYSFNSPFVLRPVRKDQGQDASRRLSGVSSKDDEVVRYVLIGNCFTRGLGESLLGFDGWLNQCFLKRAGEKPTKFVVI